MEVKRISEIEYSVSQEREVNGETNIWIPYMQQRKYFSYCHFLPGNCLQVSLLESIM